MIPTAAARTATRVPAGLFRVVGAAVAAVLVATVLTVPAAPAQTAVPRTQEEETEESPLRVSISTLTPSTVPQRGRVTVSGEIENRSESAWTDLRVYLVMSPAPMTTSEELEDATATEATVEVGPRLTSPGLYAEADDLAPGESSSYTLSVPRRELPVEGAGVYWLGVHVLGTNEDGRIDGADGRARTFIAHVPPQSPRATLALTVPLRGQVSRTSEGRLANVASWNRRLGENGRLTRLVDLAGTSFDAPLTWVVDPAIVEAARSLAEGNPGFDLAPTDEPATDGSPSPDTPLTESPGPAPSEDAEEPSEEVSRVAAESQQAAEWLADFTELAQEQTVLALPFGDVDVATLLRGEFGGTLNRAQDLSALTMVELDVESEPVIAPANGLVPNAAVRKLGPRTTMLLSESVADVDATRVRLDDGPEAILTSDAARVGGPSPTPPLHALAIRQQILARTAVHVLGQRQDEPLVISLPEMWNPGRDWRAASFFSGLDIPWIRLVDVPYARAVSEAVTYDERLRYTRAARKREIPVANVLATQELHAAGSTLEELLTRNESVDDEVGRAAMLGSSTNVRLRPHRALVRTRRISQEVHRRLGSVYVEGSPLVTMSSETGNFSVTLVNGLQEPVTVEIDVETGSDDLQIRSPDRVSLGPGQRASVRLAVTATDTGVHSVRIVPTTRDGRTLGTSTRIKVRSSQVGLVIWLIMGTGAVVFVAAIGARIRRRVGERRHEDEHRPEESTL